MIAEPLNLERSVLESLAQRYRHEGYEVVVAPRMADLPRSLQRFQPDLIARRGPEGIVVEVKRRRPTDAGASAQIEQLAQAVRTLPNWRFELVVVDDVVEGPDSGGRDWSPADVAQALFEVEELIEKERIEPALLLLYAAAEAQLRSVAAAEGIANLSHGVSPVISALTSVGVLSREEYKSLMDGLGARNAIAHGRRPEPMPDRETLLQLMEIVRAVGHEPAAIVIEP